MTNKTFFHVIVAVAYALEDGSRFTCDHVCENILAATEDEAEHTALVRLCLTNAWGWERVTETLVIPA